MLFVLVIGLSGVHAVALQQRLSRLSRLGTTVCRRACWFHGAVSAAVSQLAWWGAIVIGFLSAQ